MRVYTPGMRVYICNMNGGKAKQRYANAGLLVCAPNIERGRCEWESVCAIGI